MGVVPGGDRGGEGPAPELILDTDVFSRVTGPRAEQGRWKSQLAGVEVALAFPTTAEVLYGAYKGRWGVLRLALWIAACAIHYGLPLLTTNVRHFAGLPGLRLVS